MLKGCVARRAQRSNYTSKCPTKNTLLWDTSLISTYIYFKTSEQPFNNTELLIKHSDKLSSQKIKSIFSKTHSITTLVSVQRLPYESMAEKSKSTFKFFYRDIARRLNWKATILLIVMGSRNSASRMQKENALFQLTCIGLQSIVTVL